MTNPAPSSREIQAFFSRRAALYHNAVVRGFAYGSGLRVLLERGGYLHSGARVLDAGCGTGAVTRALVQIARRSGTEGIRINAFDLTPAMLAHLQEWLSENDVRDVDLHQANVLDLGALPTDWRGYDLIVSSAMLEYLSRAELVIAVRALAGLLAPGATMVVCITRRNALMRWLVGAWWRSRLYEREELEAIFREAGLAMRFRRFPFPVSHMNLWGHVAEVRG